MDARTVSSWLVTYLPWFNWVLLAMWAPSVLFTIAIDLDAIEAPASGYPPLTDPALVTSALQMALMAAALPGMRAQQPRSWMLLAAALGAWCAHAAWMIQGRVRLAGARTLRSPETLLAIGGIVAAAMVLLAVRRCFRHEAVHDIRGHERVAPGGPAHVP